MNIYLRNEKKAYGKFKTENVYYCAYKNIGHYAGYIENYLL